MSPRELFARKGQHGGVCKMKQRNGRREPEKRSIREKKPYRFRCFMLTFVFAARHVMVNRLCIHRVTDGATQDGKCPNDPKRGVGRNKVARDPRRNGCRDI